MRALAALSVLYAHFGSAEPTLIGHHGVRFFFMLSGFLITRNLLQMRQDMTRGVLHATYVFYARRILRLLPAFYLLIFLSYLFGADEGRASPLWFVLHISNLLFMLRNEWQPWALGHTWTLSMEEQFYLVWPWFILLVSRRYIPLVCLISLAVSVSYRFYLPVTAETLVTRDLIPLASIDALALGGLIACAQKTVQEQLRSRLVFPVFIASAATVIGSHLTGLPAGTEWSAWVWFELSTLVPFALLIMLVLADEPKIAWVARVPGLIYLGRISYGIYLYHFLVLWLLLNRTPLQTRLAENGVDRLLVATSLTIAAAAISYHFFEITHRPSKAAIHLRSGVAPEKERSGCLSSA